MRSLNFKITTALVGVLAVATSCLGDLEIVQNGKLSASNMWQDKQDVISSTYGIYRVMRNNFTGNGNVLYWGELRVGEYMWGPCLQDGLLGGFGVVIDNVMTSSSDIASWSALYSAIDQANAVLKYAPMVSMGEKDLAFAVGQASFARAYCYFWAVRLWGDVPLTLLPVESSTQEETYPERTAAQKVYEQIEKDIETAEQNAYALGSNKYFATEDAVRLLKAEYALWMYATRGKNENYLSMADSALKAIGISSSKLLASYSSIFSRSNKCNAEVIFALGNDQGESLTGGYYTHFYFPNNFVAPAYRNNPVPIKSTQYLSYTMNFINILQESKAANNDSRVDCNLGSGAYGIAGETLYWTNKFLGDMSGSSVVLDADILYYRYALAVMLDAELKYYKQDYSGALKSLNLIAKRAYGKDNFYSDSSQASVLQALCDEYFLEFPAEGVIWWALIRLDKIWDYNESLAARRNDTNILLWPITQSAINRNHKLKQTEGWN